MARGPTDEEILAFSQQVQDEAVENTPLISARLPITHLADEYRNGNIVILEKIESLSKYGGVESNVNQCYYKSRGDGDCFYRAFAFGLLLLLTHHHTTQEGQTSNGDLRTSLLEKFEASRATLDAGGFSTLVYEDFLEEMKELAQSTHDESQLLNAMNEMERSNAIVVYLRFLTSAYVKCHRDLYAAYLEEGEVVDRWCERWIEATGAEADNIQINALVNALQVGVDVVTLDGTRFASESLQQSKVASQAQILPVRPDDGKAVEVVKLLFRPGHYDLLSSST